MKDRSTIEKDPDATAVQRKCLMKWITRERVKVDRVAIPAEPWLWPKIIDKIIARFGAGRCRLSEQN
jgi:hypothetical protein